MCVHACTHSLRKESPYWSVVFHTLLALQDPISAYNLSKLGVKCIADDVDDQGILSFPLAMATYALGMHHMFIWKKNYGSVFEEDFDKAWL